MTRIDFYHLQTKTLEQTLPVLLQRALQQGHKVVVMAGSAERVRQLDAHLWTYEADSFLPHGTARDGSETLQPVFLTAADENPNQADLLILTDGVRSAHLGSFVRCLNLFDGQDEEAVTKARAAWKEWAAAGYELIYRQQTDRGNWQEKARTGGDNNKGDKDAEG